MFQTRSPIRTIAIVAAALGALFATSAIIPTAAATSGASSVASTGVMAIIGGGDQDIGEYPYMATVRVGGFFCGGTLVAVDWVLTASHCAKAGTNPRDVRVQLGVSDTSKDPGVAFPVDRVVAHDIADITLLHLGESAQDFRPIALATPEMADLWAPNTTGWAIGWGKTTENGLLSRLLHGAELDFVPDSTCTFPENDPSIVCAGGQGTGVCSGDSGGPIIVEADGVPTEVGVTSYGTFCGAEAGFVEVAHYRDWVDETIGQSYGISAQISTSCQDGSSVSAVNVTNDAPYAKSVTVRLEGVKDQVVTIPPHGAASTEVNNRPKGTYAASVLLDGVAVATLSEVVDCTYSVEFSYRCLAGDGAFDARITNYEDGPSTFDFSVGSITKSVTVDAQETQRSTISGRPDGYHKVKLLRDGAVVKEELIAVECDPPEPEVSATSSCLAGRGRVDVYLHNPTDETQTYDVALGQLSNRLATVPPDGRSRVTVTGRPDGKFAVFVQRGDGTLTIRSVTIACAPIPREPVTVAKSCLAGSGRIDVTLANSGKAPAEFAVAVGDLAERVRKIEAAMADRVIVTGRPDGPVSVVVTQDGARVYNDDVTIDCAR